MPLTKWTNSKIVVGKRAAPKRTPEQKASRDKIAALYSHPDKLFDCATCGWNTRHVWDGSAYICGCGAARE